MLQYIRLASKVTGKSILPDDEDNNDQLLDLKFEDDPGSLYSSCAKTNLASIEKEISAMSAEEVAIFDIVRSIYGGKKVTEDDLLKLIGDKDACNIRSNSGDSLLHVAVDSSNVNIFEMLVQVGLAKELVNEVNNFGMNCAHLVAINFNKTIFEGIKALGGNFDVEDLEGVTALEYLKNSDCLSETEVEVLVSGLK